MKIAVLKERKAGENRAAVSPDSVKKLIGLGADVWVESGSGFGSGISDAEFAAAGAKSGSLAECASNAAIILKVNAPETEELAAIPANAALIGMLSPYAAHDRIHDYAVRNITSFSMEFMPRISRAQSMDVLSSQANLAGYRAVIDAVYEMSKAVPMMMTAAGTVTPAKVLVLGAGVAGLQAIATAKRLGAVVFAFDVRPVVKEQVESLGAKFVEVPADTSDAETKGGYAKEMSEEYKQKQSTLIHDTLKKMDIVISTALIPGRPAPVLIQPHFVDDMKTGAVIVDMAVASGGNCPLSKMDEIVDHNGVKIIGYSNLPSRIATDATPLYARNLYNFIAAFLKDGALHWNLEDELVKGTLLTHEGKVVHPVFNQEKTA